MQTRPLGNSPLHVSVIGLGTMTFGEQNSEAEAHAQLDRAIAAGVNLIDTAELYAVPARAETCGASETIVGNWLKRQRREDLIIATKVAGPSRNLEWIRGGPLALDRANIRAAVEGSLRRLQTDYIDLYQLHWPDRNQPMFGQWQFDPAKERDCAPLRHQLEALAELVAEGKIRYIGVSNEHAWGLMQCVRLADEHALPRIVSVQNAYSLLNRTFEYGLAEISFRESIGLLAYSALAFGHLSGKYLANPAADGRLTRFDNFGQRYAKPGVPLAVRAYVDLAGQLGLTPARMALAFACQRSFVSSVLIGATTPAQLEENLSAADITLSADALEAIDRIHLTHGNPAP